MVRARARNRGRIAWRRTYPLTRQSRNRRGTQAPKRTAREWRCSLMLNDAQPERATLPAYALALRTEAIAQPPTVGTTDAPLPTPAEELAAIASRVKARTKRIAEDFFAIGEDLLRARALLLSDERFGQWREREAPVLKQKTAKRIMDMVTAFKSVTPEVGIRIDASALYYLQCNGGTKGDLRALIDTAKRGATVTLEDAKGLAETRAARRLQAKQKTARDANAEECPTCKGSGTVRRSR